SRRSARRRAARPRRPRASPPARAAAAAPPAMRRPARHTRPRTPCAHRRVPSADYLARMTVSVLIADDDPVMRMLVGAIVARDPELTLAGEAEDADAAIAAAERLRPDVALLDLEMPGGGGPAAARGIHERVPGVKVLALSAHEADAARDEMTAAG